MERTDTRTCKKCKRKIEFDLDNINGIVYHGGGFYHSVCFVDYCNGRAAESSSPIWQKHINNMLKLEDEARKRIGRKRDKDDLNNYLVKHYDITTPPDNFWLSVAELENGKYKQKKCNPVSVGTLLGAWQWGQKKLDSIDRKNRINKIGPKNGEQRIFYDFAILVNKIPIYLKAKAKLEAEEAERIAREQEKVKINYNNIYVAQTQTEGLDDISALLDDF